MRLEITGQRTDGFNEVTAYHNGEELAWQTKRYGRVKMTSPQEVFGAINQYWEWRGKDVQDKIWEVYKEIREYVDEGNSLTLRQSLKEAVAKLYDLMPMTSFSNWLLNYGTLYMPHDVPSRTSTVEDDNFIRGDRTYYQDDYIGLAVLALATRPMIPIWGEYITANNQGNFASDFKEMDAVGLLRNTELLYCPAAEQLQTYIQITAERSTPSLSSLFRGLGSADTPWYLFCLVMSARLTIVPLQLHQENASIIKNVYRYVYDKVKPDEKQQDTGPVRMKDKNYHDRGDDEDKTSRIEEYKVKEKIPRGDVVLFDIYTENIFGMAQVVDPTIDLRLLSETAKKLKPLNNLLINPHQIRLTQWVMAAAISPQALTFIKKTSVLNCVVAAQALLWHWGFYHLACLMTVEAVAGNDAGVAGLSLEAQRNPRSSPKYTEDLMVAYPHIKPVGSKNAKPEEGNVARIGINNVTKLITDGVWRYHGPAQLHRLAEQPEGRQILTLPTTLKNQLNELVLKLAAINQ